MNTENSKMNEPLKFVPNLSQRLHLARPNKHVALQNLSIYLRWKHTRKHHKNKKLKLVATTWNDESELPDSSYSASDIQSCSDIQRPKQRNYLAAQKK